MDQVIPSSPNSSRAAHYRAQAQSLREMAEGEPGSLRERLLTLADQYDGLASTIDAKGEHPA